MTHSGWLSDRSSRFDVSLVSHLTTIEVDPDQVDCSVEVVCKSDLSFCACTGRLPYGSGTLLSKGVFIQAINDEILVRQFNSLKVV